MKFNCDRLGDWLKKKVEQHHAKEAVKFEKQIQWHKKFVFYRRIGHGDCRVLEFVEARIVPRSCTRYRYGMDWEITIWRWEYRPITTK